MIRAASRAATSLAISAAGCARPTSCASTRYGDPLADRTRAGRKWTTSNGYVKQGVDHAHPLGDGQSTTGVHRAVLHAAIGEGPHPCHWCGVELQWRRHLPSEPWDGVLVVDHLDGDKQHNEVSNLVPSCFSCNALRARWGDEAASRRAKLITAQDR